MNTAKNKDAQHHKKGKLKYQWGIVFMDPIVRVKMLTLSIKCRNGLSHTGIGENWYKIYRKKLWSVLKYSKISLGSNPIIPLTEIYS